MTQQEQSSSRPKIVTAAFDVKSKISSGLQLKDDEDAGATVFGGKNMTNSTGVVPISSLEAADSPRLSGENLEHVRTLAESGCSLPPIVVHRDSMRVIDGMHRLQAAILCGRDEIEVCFFDGDERDAFVFAVQANVAHGLPLSSADRKAAAERIVLSHPEWSDRAVAMVAGLSAKRVAEIRLTMVGETPEIKKRVGRDGRFRPVNGIEGRRFASELIRKDPAASLREIAREAGLSPATVADVRARMARGEDPIPQKRRNVPKRENGMGNRDSYDRVPADKRQNSFVELRKVIESLKGDPSLRFNDAGRILLRVLDTCMLAGQKKQQIVDNLPAHQITSIAEILRGCAEILQVFADDLQCTGGNATGVSLGGLS